MDASCKGKREEILRLHSEDRTICNNSETTGLPKFTVSDIINKFLRTGSSETDRLGKCGWKKSLSPRSERRIIRVCQQNLQASARDSQKPIPWNHL